MSKITTSAVEGYGQENEGQEDESLAELFDSIQCADSTTSSIFGGNDVEAQLPAFSTFAFKTQANYNVSVPSPLQPVRRARVVITEEPAHKPKGYKFRYECEGKRAGSIPGANSTASRLTYPSIRIDGYKGRALVIVSCVTNDFPHKPHPHKLVGLHCKDGICAVEINPVTMTCSFENLGIQCVKKADIDKALRHRKKMRVDPFRTGFDHRSNPSLIDLNAVRLCFQVFVQRTHNGQTSFSSELKPAVSSTIYDKKALTHLVIIKMSKTSSSVAGGEDIILLCEKVTKEDIAIRIFGENNGKKWERFGSFELSDVHKQVAISFRTPPYHTLDIDESVQCFIQLQKISDKSTGEPRPFEYIPLSASTRKRKLPRQEIDNSLRNEILGESHFPSPSFGQQIASSEKNFGYGTSTHPNVYGTDYQMLPVHGDGVAALSQSGQSTAASFNFPFMSNGNVYQHHSTAPMGLPAPSTYVGETGNNFTASRSPFDAFNQQYDGSNSNFLLPLLDCATSVGAARTDTWPVAIRNALMDIGDAAQQPKN